MNELSRFLAENLANSLPVGIYIAVLAWAATRLVRTSGSRVRFAIWISALAAIVVLPWAGALRDTSYRRAPALTTTALTLPGSITRYVVLAWLIGMAIGLMYVGFGLFRLRRLRATCAPVNVAELDLMLRATVESARGGRAVTLCTSEAVRVPAAIGYFQPIVVVPKWALLEIDPQELNAILLHELAHLRRYDDWTNLVQKVIKAILFFHPAVWFIESRLTLEREMACDDAVLAANFSPRAYAASLVGLAEKSYLRRTIQMAQGAVGHIRQLKLRLAEILRKDRSELGSARFAKASLAFLAIASLCAVYSSTRFPRLIAFSGDSGSTLAEVHSSTLYSQDADSHPVNVRLSWDRRPASMCAKPRVAVRRVLRQSSSVAVRRAALDGIPQDPTPPILRLSDSEPSAAMMPVVLIFQAHQFGPDGAVFWRVTVIHLTPYQQQVVSGQSPKQI